MTAVVPPAEQHTASLENLYRTGFPSVVRYAMTKVQDAGMAEEIAQDAMVGVWQMAEKATLDESVNSLPIAMHIGKLRAIDRFRSMSAKIRPVYLDQTDPASTRLLDREATDNTATVAAKVDAETLVKELFANQFYASTTASAENAVNVAQGLMDDLSYEQIAQKYSLPLGTVKTTVRRMKERLTPHYGARARAIID